MTTLAQGATNSLAQFVRIVLKILAPHLRDRASQFLDDVGIKGPKTTNNNEKLAPGIRRYVVEHIQNLDKALADLERAGVTIAGAKCFYGTCVYYRIWIKDSAQVAAPIYHLFKGNSPFMWGKEQPYRTRRYLPSSC